MGRDPGLNYPACASITCSNLPGPAVPRRTRKVRSCNQMALSICLELVVGAAVGWLYMKGETQKETPPLLAPVKAEPPFSGQRAVAVKSLIRIATGEAESWDSTSPCSHLGPCGGMFLFREAADPEVNPRSLKCWACVFLRALLLRLHGEPKGTKPVYSQAHRRVFSQPPGRWAKLPGTQNAPHFSTFRAFSKLLENVLVINKKFRYLLANPPNELPHRCF